MATEKEGDAELKESGKIAEPEKKKLDSSAGNQDSKGKGESKKSSGAPENEKAKPKKKEAEKGNPIKEAIQFLKEVRVEFYKITWPELPQVVRETWSVLFLVAAITLMVLGFDWILAQGFFGPLEHWARLHGGGIGSG